MHSWKVRCSLALLVGIALTSTALAQWPADPAQNLALADRVSDQVQPKLLPRPDGSWLLSWFDANPHGHPPYGYDVYVQALDAGGVQLAPHNGLRVADLGLSSTEDYGMSVDTAGNELVAFLDDREGDNEQVTAAKVSPKGQMLWGKLGIQLTNDENSNNSPRITGTSDGDVVVAWSSNSNLVLQKLDPNGNPLWGSGVVLTDPKASYFAADLHAAEKGSVIVSFVRSAGFSSPQTLLAAKLSASGASMWGAQPLAVFDGGSLQFGEFPYFIPDGSGGAVFSWYSSSPTLQVYAQHILANGTEAFPHNGAVGSNNLNNVHVSPSVAYRRSTGETFLFWTEEDGNQFTNGVSGQKFDRTGAQQWGSNGLTIVPLGADSQLFVQAVQTGTGAQIFWVDEPGFDQDTMNAVRLDGSGNVTCPIFPVSTTISGKSRLAAAIGPTGLSAVVFEDDRTGDQNIYLQNVNQDCSLGYSPIRCSELKGAKTSCDNGTLNVQITLKDLRNDGNSLTLQVNAVDHTLPIQGQRAKFSGPGQGQNTLLLTNPAGCAQQKMVQCP
ncbi:MAG: hypothetical protein ACRD3L_05165 [Terriglobales bacterium]